MYNLYSNKWNLSVSDKQAQTIVNVNFILLMISFYDKIKTGKTLTLLKEIFSALQMYRQVIWNIEQLIEWSFHTWFLLQVDKKLFEQALLKLNREEFIEIFLDHGFLIHKYLNHKKYKLLYEKAEDREFFISICLEKVLGQIVVRPWRIMMTVFCRSRNEILARFSIHRKVYQQDGIVYG